MTGTRRFWGWGWEEVEPTEAELGMVEAGLAGALGMTSLSPRARPRAAELSLPAARVSLPSSLGHLQRDSPVERAQHSYGRSYRDLVRATALCFDHPPDIVAYPQSEDDVRRVLDFASTQRIAVIPYGGGSSVCGGVEPLVEADFRGTLSLDLTRLSCVLEVDRESRCARVQAGVLGPHLEAQLRGQGLTLRHFPQSFEFSSLGGWIATRAGGHFATVYTHIDDLVQAVRVITPSGALETRRLPGSGAGPDPNRLFLGSEGTLGVITEAWVRLQQRPIFRAKANVRFESFRVGATALRVLSQSGLYPANARLVDPVEAMLNGVGDGQSAVLLLGFESHDHNLDAWMSRAVEICRAAGGLVPDSAVVTRTDAAASSAGDAGTWRQSFLRAPYLRDELVLRGVFVETFETAVTWDRFEGLHDAVVAAARRALGQPAVVTCRITHVYPDGPAPYFTVIAPARLGSELTQWAEVKDAITLAMLEHGGTTTHHHAVGRDVVPYYEQERPEPFARAMRAVKRELDPQGVLNPGVLWRE